LRRPWIDDTPPELRRTVLTESARYVIGRKDRRSDGTREPIAALASTSVAISACRTGASVASTAGATMTRAKYPESAKSTLRLRSGRKIPVLGLGTWQLRRETAATVARAFDLGYCMVDTSGDYGTQPGIGKVLKKHAHARDSLFIVTKVEETDDAYVAAKKNLAELGTEYANLILIHRPPENGVGSDLWKGLIQAKHEGLAQDIGVSNYSAEQIRELAQSSGEMPAVNQVEWSPFGHSQHLLDFCRENQLVLQAYSPLTRTQRLDDDTVRALAEKHAKTPAQLLIRWNLQLGTVPLPKANRITHLKANLDVFDFELSDEEMSKLNALNERYSSLGSLPYW
jgi:diketogulonate reductase-like aldo/keto reductase